MAQSFQQTGIMSQAELVRFGYAAATKRERKDFELPEFCLHDHYRYLPLHIQVMFRDEAVAPTGVDELVHYRKDFTRFVPTDRVDQLALYANAGAGFEDVRA